MARALIVNEQVVELSDGMYRALCGLVHPSEAIDPADVVADEVDWQALRALFPLADARTVESESAECANCGRSFHVDDLNHEVKHLHERVDPGGAMPAGECPECGALAFPV